MMFVMDASPGKLKPAAKPSLGSLAWSSAHTHALQNVQVTAVGLAVLAKLCSYRL